MSPSIQLAILVGVSVALNGLAVGQRAPFARLQLKFSTNLWLIHLARLAYYLGLPYISLRAGLIPPRAFGLADLTAADIPVSVVLAFAALFLLSLGRRSDPLSGPAVFPAHWAERLLEVLYLQFHWALYRGAFIVWTGQDFYTGSLLGVVLVCAESLLDPRVRRALLHGSSDTAGVVAGWTVVFTLGIVFFFARTLWLLVPLHAVIQLGAGWARAHPHSVSGSRPE